ncbi:hypothetical protein GM547_14755, partial [Streptococcus pneumoniae]|nr:hypothetical protein [Streptococcus pneumoniae]
MLLLRDEAVIDPADTDPQVIVFPVAVIFPVGFKVKSPEDVTIVLLLRDEAVIDPA